MDPGIVGVEVTDPADPCKLTKANPKSCHLNFRTRAANNEYDELGMLLDNSTRNDHAVLSQAMCRNERNYFIHRIAVF